MNKSHENTKLVPKLLIFRISYCDKNIFLSENFLSISNAQSRQENTASLLPQKKSNQRLKSFNKGGRLL